MSASCEIWIGSVWLLQDDDGLASDIGKHLKVRFRMLAIAACLLDCNETTSKLALFCCYTLLVVGNQVASLYHGHRSSL
jgi:hypothetical protein